MQMLYARLSFTHIGIVLKEMNHLTGCSYQFWHILHHLKSYSCIAKVRVLPFGGYPKLQPLTIFHRSFFNMLTMICSNAVTTEPLVQLKWLPFGP